MKKITKLTLLFTLCIMFFFGAVSCNKETKTVKPGSTIIVGVTDYAPLDYIDEVSGKWVGFDAELATAVFTNLGYTVEFKEIDWDTKIVTLNSGKIDVIWNGMTVNDQLLDNLLLTSVYLKNQQVAVCKTSDVSKYVNVESLAGKTVAVESGSAAESAVEDAGCKEVKKLTNQNSAVLNVFSNTADVAIIDYALAKTLTAPGSTYAGTLSMVDIQFEVEEFSAAVRKSDSKLLWQINKQLAALTKDGTIATLAAKYNLSNQLPENF